MRDIVKGILIWFLTALFMEKAPIVAKALVRWSVQRLPKTLQDRYTYDCQTDLSLQSGPLAQLGYALKIVFAIPSIRLSHGHSAVTFQSVVIFAGVVNILFMGLINVGSLIAIFSPELIASFVKPVVIIGAWFGMGSAFLAGYVLVEVMRWRIVPVWLSGGGFVGLMVAILFGGPRVLEINMEKMLMDETAFFLPFMVGVILMSRTVQEYFLVRSLYAEIDSLAEATSE